MEDPWGGSAAWVTPAKASSSKAPIMEMPRTPPSGAAPVSDDPWGAPASAGHAQVTAQAATLELRESTALPIDPVSEMRPSLEGMHGWSADNVVGGWGEPSPPAGVPSSDVDNGLPDAAPATTMEMPSLPADVPQEAVWKLDSPETKPVDLGSAPWSPGRSQPDAGAGESARSAPSTPPPRPQTPDYGSHAFETITTPRSTRLSALGSPGPAALASPSRSAFGSSPPFAGAGMTRTTSFGSGAGSDFGGFSGGFGAGGGYGGAVGGGGFGDGADPWGAPSTTFASAASPQLGDDTSAATGFGGEPWGGDINLPDINSVPTAADEEEEDDGDGWGGAKSRNVMQPPPAAEDQDWEEAQRRMRLQEERAPPERVNQLRSDWKELAESWIGLRKLEGLSKEEEEQLEASVRQILQLNEDNLNSLATIPPDVNTYPPVLSSFTTLHSLVSALAQPNRTPSTSILYTSAQRVARRSEQMTFDAAGTSWTSRSRLGEPDAPMGLEPAPADAAEETQRGKWSFWGRKGQEPKQLVTSGGGLLEVKPIAPISATGSPAPLQARPSMSSRSVSIASAQPSRPASPAITSGSAASAIPPSEDLLSAPAAGPSAGTGAAHPVAGPSRMSRFFGRFRKADADANEASLDAKDLELNVDDFGFLGEVPSLPGQAQQTPDVGDLLSIPGQAPPPAAQGLQEMLGNGRPPATEAASPGSRGVSGPTWSKYGAQAQPSGRFVAKMKSGPPEMDLLGGMDSGETAAGATASSSRASAGGGGLWDAFMDEPSGPSTVAQSKQPSLPAAATTAANDDFADFDDFAAPPAPAAAPANRAPAPFASFDDFGDFDSFASAPAGPAPQKARQVESTLVQERIPFGQSFASPAPPPKINHAKKPSLDHEHTRTLLNDAEAVKGKRWPAPPSPGVPALEPPPKAPASSGFPFLVPPPPAPTSRPGSTLGRKADFLGSSDMDGLAAPVPSPGAAGGLAAPTTYSSGVGALAPPMALSGSQSSMGSAGVQRVTSPPLPSAPTSSATLQPARIASPHTSSQAKQPSTGASGGGNKGLSAQDLSFFDSL